MNEQRPDRFVCGTRRTAKFAASDFRVVCSTCGAGGTISYATREAANAVTVRDSNKPCPGKPPCGAT